MSLKSFKSIFVCLLYLFPSLSFAGSGFELTEGQTKFAALLLVIIIVGGLILEHTPRGKKYFKYFYVATIGLPTVTVLLYVGYIEKDSSFYTYAFFAFIGCIAFMHLDSGTKEDEK